MTTFGYHTVVDQPYDKHFHIRIKRALMAQTRLINLLFNLLVTLLIVNM